MDISLATNYEFELKIDPLRFKKMAEPETHCAGNRYLVVAALVHECETLE